MHNDDSLQWNGHDVNCGSAASRQSNGSGFPVVNGQRVNKGYCALSPIESKEEFFQLSLIPLHPAAKKPAAKQLPIVLGRTNLAAWWWKSCPCQHYCRLHCRPVAQNIRSLSKVMIQIDTSGHFHMVGKNPHLVVITPERPDNILRENDIISFGRRDREPWMRFQAVRKPPVSHMGPTFDITLHTPAAPLPAANARRNRSDPNSPEYLKDSAPSRSNPPEWITTNTRKRKSGGSSSNSLSSLSKVLPAPMVDVRLRPASAQEGASANATTRLQEPDVKDGHQRTTLETSAKSNRKRKHRSAPVEETTGKEAKQRRSSRSARKTNEVNLFDRAMGGYKPTTNGDDRGRDHPHVHLIFQYYQTSAALLQGNEIRRKSESSINQATLKASRAESVVRYQQDGLDAPSRAFIADTSQLRLLSRNFAQALLGAVSPTKREEPTSRAQEESSAATRAQEDSEKRSEAESVNLAAQKPRALPTSDVLKQRAKSPVSNKCIQDCVKHSSVDDDEHPTVDKDKTASILSVPKFASSSFYAVQKINVAGEGVSVDRDEEIDVPCDEDSSSSSRASCDPILDLKPWQDMMELEKANGSISSFRYALASLIVAKNHDRLNDPGRRTPSWLPSLIGEDFTLERPKDKR